MEKDIKGRSIAGLILGISSILFVWCFPLGLILGIVGLVLSIGVRKGNSLGRGGFICGLIGTALSALVALIVLIGSLFFLWQGQSAISHKTDIEIAPYEVSEANLTYESFLAIEMGMSYQEVSNIFSVSDIDFTGDGEVIWYAEEAPEKYIDMRFADNEVVYKSQWSLVGVQPLATIGLKEGITLKEGNRLMKDAILQSEELVDDGNTLLRSYSYENNEGLYVVSELTYINERLESFNTMILGEN